MKKLICLIIGHKWWIKEYKKNEIIKFITIICERCGFETKKRMIDKLEKFDKAKVFRLK